MAALLGDIRERLDELGAAYERMPLRQKLELAPFMDPLLELLELIALGLQHPDKLE